MRKTLLHTVRNVIAHIRIPGRYMLANSTARLCMPETGEVEGYIGPYRVTSNLREEIQRFVFFNLYEPPETRLLHKLLKPGDVFFDIGANIGYYSLLGASLVGTTGQIHSFEPIPENVIVLKHALEANSISNIVVNQVAVGSHSGKLTLYAAEEGQGGSPSNASSIASPRRTRSIVANMISLDEYIRAHSIPHVKLIKLDIEGGELDALSGMNALLSHSEAPDLFCEINPYFLKVQNNDPRSITNYLSQYNYYFYLPEKIKSGPISTDHVFRSVTNLYCTKHTSV